MLPPTAMLPLMSRSSARLTGLSPRKKSRISFLKPESMTSKSDLVRFRMTLPSSSRTDTDTVTTSTPDLNVACGAGRTWAREGSWPEIWELASRRTRAPGSAT